MATGTVVRMADFGPGCCMIYTAWERSGIAGRHSTITTIDGRWYGQIGTDPDPKAYDHLPAMSDERIAACRTEYERRYAVAYAEILAVHPEAVRGGKRNGEIIVPARERMAAHV